MKSPEGGVRRKGSRSETSRTQEQAIEELKRVFIQTGTFHRSKTGAVEAISFEADTQEKLQQLGSLFRSLSLEHPWLEEGRVYIERKGDFEKLQSLLILSPKLVFEPRKGSTIPSPHSFPYPSTQKEGVNDEGDIKPIAPITLQGEPIGEYELTDADEGTEPDDAYDTLRNIVNAFDQGVDDGLSDEEKTFSAQRMPTLSLFPMRYRWENGQPWSLRDGTPLTQDNLEDMREHAKDGDERAMRELISINVGLVIRKLMDVAKRRKIPDIDDAFQMGLRGLVRAIELHDPDQGAFSTYASLRIEGAIRQYLNEGDGTKMPLQLRRERVRHLHVRERWVVEHGREPSDEEVAETLQMPLESVREMHNLFNANHAHVSLEELIEDEHRHLAEEHLVRLQDEAEEESRKDFFEALKRYISRRFSPRYERVLRAYYPSLSTFQLKQMWKDGVRSPEPTLESVGQELDIQREQVRKMIGDITDAARDRISKIGVDRFISEELKGGPQRK